MTRTFVRIAFLSAFCLTGALNCPADSLIVDGECVEGVVVREGTHNYYVQYPETGTVESYARSRVQPGSVLRASDRPALLAQWKAKARPGEGSASGEIKRETSETRSEEQGVALDSEPSAQLRNNRGRGLSLVMDIPSPPDETVSHTIASLQLDGVSLDTALKVILREAGLDYVIQGGILYISDAETLRRESLEAVETRTYPLENIGAETLPKIVLRNPGVTGGTGQGGGGQF